MNERVFLDTNLLLDVLAQRHEAYAESALIWTLCEQGTIDGFISVISFNNVFYVLRKLRGQKDARRAISQLRLIFKPVTLDERLLDQAISAGFEDFEDALQYYSALRAEASSILSRNPKDFPAKSVIPVVSPTEFLRVRTFPQSSL